MSYRVGTLLKIGNLEAKVIGFIQYANTSDHDKTWMEYRLKTKEGERWLSCDDIYNEYSISWAANGIRGHIGPEWHKVDEGNQVVRTYGGDVDVDPGERAAFIEYEDASEDHILSVEIWEDGTEYSNGYYIEKSDIVEIGYEQPKSGPNSGLMVFIFFLAFFALPFIMGTCSTLCGSLSGGKKISTYLKEKATFSYVTSISGSGKEKADVYEFIDITQATTDDVAKLIITGIEGNTESVTQKDETANEEIAILTKKEYCLIYHPEDDANKVYVQISSRKYVYSSDNTPYKSSSSNHTWYRSHYYSSGYSKDVKSFKSTPSAYSMYKGDTIHNIGNGYFDTYSSSVRQSSINSRKSSSGGISSGK